jgi:sugar phosphate isomerase/epimerase
VRYRVWIEESLADFSTRTGVTVAVENMFPIRLPADREVRFHAGRPLEDMDHVPHLVLDTSHAAVAGLDVREAFAAARDRIRHIHLSNNAGKGWDSHLPVDQDGVIPIEAFLGDLAGDGFAGAVSLELDLRPWMKDEAALREVLVRNRELCERHLAPA